MRSQSFVAFAQQSELLSSLRLPTARYVAVMVLVRAAVVRGSQQTPRYAMRRRRSHSYWAHSHVSERFGDVALVADALAYTAIFVRHGLGDRELGPRARWDHHPAREGCSGCASSHGIGTSRVASGGGTPDPATAIRDRHRIGSG